MFKLSAKQHRKLERRLSALKADPHVQQMKQYRQHGRTSTFDHCERVAALSYAIDQRFHLNADLDALLPGAMLHDFALYDWHDPHDPHNAHGLHGLRHAKMAQENARELLGASDQVQHIIWCHMWPLNLTRLPRSKEAWIVCVADKCAAVGEVFHRRGTF